MKFIETMATSELDASGEYPKRVELRKTVAENPLPSIPPETFEPSVTGEELTRQALSVITALNTALAAGDVEALERCFFPEQSYWKDQVALTYYMRTFRSPGVVAANLLAAQKARGIPGGFSLAGTPFVIPVSPTLVSTSLALAVDRNYFALMI